MHACFMFDYITYAEIEFAQNALALPKSHLAV